MRNAECGMERFHSEFRIPNSAFYRIRHTMFERLQNIKLLLLDVDGVLTDGRIIFDSNGVESKFFNVKDGHGIKMVQRSGIEVGIISGRKSVVVTNRAAELAIAIVHQGAANKVEPYLEILA